MKKTTPKKSLCKLLYEHRGVQFAVDKNNILFIRTWGSGYKGHGAWGCWYPIDLAFRGWSKLDGSRVKPICDNPKNYKPLPDDFVDTFETVVNLYNN